LLKIGGGVEFAQTSISAGLYETAINMKSAIVLGPVVFHSGTFIDGGLSLFLATLHTGLFTRSYDQISVGVFGNVFEKRAFYSNAVEGDLKPLTVTGPLLFKYSKIYGPVSLIGASLGERIDLEKGKTLIAFRIGGQRAGTKADDPDVFELPGKGPEYLSRRARWMIIHAGHPAEFSIAVSSFTLASLP